MYSYVLFLRRLGRKGQKSVIGLSTSQDRLVGSKDYKILMAQVAEIQLNPLF